MRNGLFRKMTDAEYLAWSRLTAAYEVADLAADALFACGHLDLGTEARDAASELFQLRRTLLKVVEFRQ
jgi:hypothetical protein